MVIKTYKLGNTEVKICDDAFVQTQDEVNFILARVSEIATKVLTTSKNPKQYAAHKIGLIN